MTSQEKAQLLVNYTKANQDTKQYYEQLKTVLTLDDWLHACDSWEWTKEVDVHALENIVVDDNDMFSIPSAWNKCHGGKEYSVENLVYCYMIDLFRKEITVDKMIGATVKNKSDN